MVINNYDYTIHIDIFSVPIIQTKANAHKTKV